MHLERLTAAYEWRLELTRDLRLMREFVHAARLERPWTDSLQDQFRALHYFLGQLDPQRVYCGLRLATTPDGHRLWLCPFHYAELQPLALPVETAFVHDAFLCHNTKDKDVVRRIAARLKKRGITYWLDEERILGGERWQDSMARGLRESAVTVVCLGEHPWGRWQWEELQVALDQAAGGERHRVIPLLLPARTEQPDDLPAFLKTRHFLRLASLQDKKGFSALVRSIRGRATEEGGRGKGGG
jgi:hypothetical protein